MPELRVIPPVETEAGDALRREALRILSDRYRKLVKDSKTFSFSPIEGTVMEATARALEALTAMAPIGPLVPANAKDWFGERLPLALPQT